MREVAKAESAFAKYSPFLAPCLYADGDTANLPTVNAPGIQETSERIIARDHCHNPISNSKGKERPE